MFENDLLQPQEGALVVDALTKLHGGAPHVLGLTTMAIRAEVVLNDEFNDKDLLEDGSVENFVLDCELDLEAL